MQEVVQYKNKVIKISFIFFAIGFVVLAVIQTSAEYIGLLLGFIISAVNFHLLAIDVTKIGVLARRNYQSVLILRYFMRYGMIGLALFCAFKYELNVLAFLVGVFLVQIVLILDNITTLRQSS